MTYLVLSSNTELFSLAADGHGAFVSTDSLLQHCAVDTVGGALIGSVMVNHLTMENCYYFLYYFNKSIKGTHTHCTHACAKTILFLCAMLHFLATIPLFSFVAVQGFILTSPLHLFPLLAFVTDVTDFYAEGRSHGIR